MTKLQNNEHVDHGTERDNAATSNDNLLNNTFVQQLLVQEETDSGSVQFVSPKDTNDPFNARLDCSKQSWMTVRGFLLLPLAIIRLIVITFFIAFVTFANQFLLWLSGISTYSELSGWRKQVFDGIFQICARSSIFVLGVYRINRVQISEETMKQLQEQVRSRPYKHEDIAQKQQEQQSKTDGQLMLDSEMCNNTRVDPPAIVVCNHVTSFDAFLLKTHVGSFTAVAKAEAKHSLIGGAAKMMEALFLDRENRSKIVYDMYMRTKRYYECMIHKVKCATDPRPAPLVIFPEGTTTSGHLMLKFNTGAFRIGAPVLPVVLRLPYRYFNMGWTSELPALKYFLLHYTQIFVPATIIGFPKYIPNEQERSDAKFYAENVRRVMAAGANLMCPEMPKMTLYNKLFGRFHDNADHNSNKLKSQ